MLVDQARLECRVQIGPLTLEAFEWRRFDRVRHHRNIAAARARAGALSPYRAMDIHFLGGATTVTGSQFLLVTERARVLIDCGMFQGSPNESIRNRVPFAFEPAELDAMLLTHAHLDHCGLIPLLVKDGYRGPIHATAGTVELATLVLLDSGKLHEEFAKRNARWEQRNPDKAAADDREDADQYAAAVALAEAGENGEAGATGEAGEHVPTAIEPVLQPTSTGHVAARPGGRAPCPAARARGRPR